jgi:UDP-glucose 4-epimerase
VNAAALKQITVCEYHPFQSVKTNILGVQYLVDAVNRLGGIETVIGISTDKACQPVNVYGMGKAIQERIYVEANLHGKGTRFLCVRYGNVLESRGSVIPLFKEQIQHGGPVSITLPHMTRFLLSLRQSVGLIMAAYRDGLPGDLWIPRVPSATVGDIAEVLIGGRPIPTASIGIRPGEKIHETLISEEEVFRTVECQGHFVIEPILPELQSGDRRRRDGTAKPVQFQRYSSVDFVLSKEALTDLFRTHGVI